MTRLPQVLRNVRVGGAATAVDRPATRRADVRRGRGRARRAGPGADPPERHRTAGAGDGRGADRDEAEAAAARWRRPSSRHSAAGRGPVAWCPCAGSSRSSVRRSHGRSPTSDALTADLDAAALAELLDLGRAVAVDIAPASVSAGRRPASPTSTACCAASPGVRALLPDRAWSPRSMDRSGTRLEAGSARARALLDESGSRLRARHRSRQRRPRPLEGRALGGATTTACAPHGGRRAGRPDRRRAAIEACASIQPRCRRSTASRCAAATRPACTSSSTGTASTSSRPPYAPSCSSRVGDPLFGSGAVRDAATGTWLRLQGGRRDRRAGRQHRGPARRDRWPTTCSGAALGSDGARGDGARPHPLGQRRHHLRGQRPPAQPRGGRARRAPTSSPCSTATSTTSPS